jgi:diaminopimelate epimerase
MVGHARQAVIESNDGAGVRDLGDGEPFYKMSGSGNDFVVIDARGAGPGPLEDPRAIRRICARGTGVGADGIVFLEPSTRASVRLRYLNADGSRAAFCGNATLCGTRLGFELGMAKNGALSIETDEGVVQARMRGTDPEIDLEPVVEVRDAVGGIPLESGESRLGFAQVGVPHVVIRCADTRLVDVVGRGRPLRSHRAFPDGANVNFVSEAGLEGGQSGAWAMRTYERGVEAETLACGSGAVAVAILLATWGEADPGAPIKILSRSGMALSVRLQRSADSWLPSLSGEGRIVFRGALGEL